MNYELAKKLKDNGFPQIDVNTPCPSCVKQKHCFDGCGCEDDVYTPNLEELIEACGDDFDSMGKFEERDINMKSKKIIRTKSYWYAKPERAVSNDLIGAVSWFFGDTPCEAVANLWLALNKK